MLSSLDLSCRSQPPDLPPQDDPPPPPPICVVRDAHSSTTAPKSPALGADTGEPPPPGIPHKPPSVGFCSPFSRRRNKHSSWSIDVSKAFEVELTALDSSRAMASNAGIGAITFYTGDLVRAKLFLKGRVAAIVAANPWLGGALQKRKGLGVMVYEPGNPHPECFKLGVVPGLWAKEKHFDRLMVSMGDMAPHLVRNGFALYGSEATPVFQVSLLTESALDERRAPSSFALAVTVTHIIADGHTFYSLYRMLDPGAQVAPLNPTRATDVDAMEKELVGGFAALQGCMIGMMRNMVFGSKRQIVLYEIDVDALNSRKASLAGEGGVDFVSSNDIVTAAFFTAVRDDVNLMAINLRNKVPSYTDDMAGNYEACIWYAPRDVETPALIRKSLCPRPGFYRAAEPPTVYPGLATRARGGVNVASTWATFYGDVSLPGCEQKMHLPLFDYDMAARCQNFCITFRPFSGKLSLVCGFDAKARFGFEADLAGIVRVV